MYNYTSCVMACRGARDREARGSRQEPAQQQQQQTSTLAPPSHEEQASTSGPKEAAVQQKEAEQPQGLTRPKLLWGGKRMPITSIASQQVQGCGNRGFDLGFRVSTRLHWHHSLPPSHKPFG
jgi:hypothetical protein